jgi:hypothetical protein
MPIEFHLDEGPRVSTQPIKVAASHFEPRIKVNPKLVELRRAKRFWKRSFMPNIATRRR